MRRLAALLLIAAVFSVPAYAGGRRGQSAPPQLLEPSEHADLHGKTELLFRWRGEGGSEISDYQVKLYKGTQTVEAGLIKAETIPSKQDRLSLPAELFENGQTYTWQMRGTGAAKTRSVYTNFKVKK